MGSGSFSKRLFPHFGHTCGLIRKRSHSDERENPCVGVFASLRAQCVIEDKPQYEWTYDRIFTWLNNIDKSLDGFYLTFDGSAQNYGWPEGNSSAALSNTSSRPLPVPLQRHRRQVNAEATTFQSISQGPSAQEASASYFAPVGPVSNEVTVNRPRPAVTPCAPSFHSFVIGNLGPEITSARLHGMFQSLSHILPSFSSAEVVRHPLTRESLGYARVYFQDERDKQWATVNLQGLNCGGNRMHIYSTTYQAPWNEQSEQEVTQTLTPRAPAPSMQPNIKWTVANLRNSNSSSRTLNSTSSKSTKSSRDFYEIDWAAQIKRKHEASSDRLADRTKRLISIKRDGRQQLQSAPCSAAISNPQSSTSVNAGASTWKSFKMSLTPNKNVSIAQPYKAHLAGEADARAKDFKLTDFKLSMLKWKRRKSSISGASSEPNSLIFRRRVLVPGEDDGGDSMQTELIDVFAMPEHLPNSPMCPASLRYRGSAVECPYHGPRMKFLA